MKIEINICYVTEGIAQFIIIIIIIVIIIIIIIVIIIIIIITNTITTTIQASVYCKWHMLLSHRASIHVTEQA
jgi:hypothetical protein